MRHFLKCFLSLIALFSFTLRSAPPTDLSDVDGSDSNKKIVQKRITEDDLTFTGEDGVAPAVVSASQMAYAVFGKSLPGRKGKNILSLKKGTRVLVIKESKDKRWWAVQTLQGTKAKSWVPKASVLMPPKKAVSH